MNNEDLKTALRDSVHSDLLLWTVRALMESHPNPESFRESWAHMLGQMYRNSAVAHGKDPEFFSQVQAEFRRQQKGWESFLPDSESALRKPGNPGGSP